MDTTDGTSQDTGSEALNLRQAAEAIANQLTPKGDSEEGEALETDEVSASEEEDDTSETDEEQSDTEGDEAQQPAELADDLTVKVGDSEVTLHELKRGFLREQDYTRKTMEVAEVRKGLEAEKSSTAQERSELAARIAEYEAFLQRQEEADLAELRHTDPAEFAARTVVRDAERKRAAAERADHEAKAQEAAKAQYNQAINDRDAKLLEAVPAWKDDAKLKADLVKMLGYAQERGIAPKHILDATDPQMFLLLKDAAAWHDLQAKKVDVQRKVSEAPKPAKPGSTPVKVVTDLTRSKQRLAKTGSVKDAAEAFMHLNLG